MNKTKKAKNQDTREKRSSHKVRGVSPEAGKESMWWERFVKEEGFEPGVKEWRVMTLAMC